MSENLFVLTGGPGSGKSTLLSALAARGFPVAEEAGRAVIREQVEQGGSALPWDDRMAFAREMLARDVSSYSRFAGSATPVLFDRGIPDIAGYLRLCDLDVPDDVADAARRFAYAQPVFIAPFWPEIYTQDIERKQDPAEAERTFLTMRQVYTELGYRLVELPKADVKTRADFVIETISSSHQPY